MESIRSLTDVTSKRVLVRSSLNVPTEEGKVLNDFRLRKSLETIEYLRKRGARVILLGHVSGESSASLLPVYETLKNYLPLSFVPDVVGEQAKKAIAELREGQVLLLENLRRYAGETENDLSFAQSLASLGDIYVGDDFSVMHRKHASVVLVPGLMKSYSGFVIEEEVAHLTKALAPQAPSLAVLGGAKFHTKEPLIRKCLPLYDYIFVGGALANDFLKAKGFEVGKSLVADSQAGISDLLTNPKILLPIDVTVQGPNGKLIKNPVDVAPTESVLDVGPKTIGMLIPYIERSKTILWNGPLGNYEHGFIEQTEALAHHISVGHAETVVGGGDTIAAIERTSFDPARVFLSTGGGSMIEFLTQGTLPGLEALGFRKTP